MTLCDLFTSDFAQAFWSNLLAGLVVGAIAFAVIEWRLHLHRGRAARKALRRAALGIVRDELKHDEEARQRLLELLPSNALPYPLFDVIGWSLLSQADILTALEPNSIGPIVRAYNRLRTANEAFLQVHDLMFGATGILAVTAIETMTDDDQRFLQEKQFNASRDSARLRLLERGKELEEPLAEARQAVDHELARD